MTLSAAQQHQMTHATSGDGPAQPLVRQVDALDVRSLAKFVDPLPIPPIAKPVGVRHEPARNTLLYRVEMQPVVSRIHRDVPPTHFWSYGATFPGPTFDTLSGEGFWVDWVNRLPRKHFLPVDHTIHGAGEDVPEVRATVHVHGARVPSDSDGHPERWIVPGQTARFYYPNQQEAATLWYHDHTMGINRLNVYAGLIGAFLIRDRTESALGLPQGRYDIPLIICDRLLRSDGQLDYPASTDPRAPWVPEVFGDALLINGTLTPYLDVEPRKYRFRVVNGSNGRFIRLQLSNGKPFTQISTDQGLLDAPLSVDAIHLAPAERADVVLDFSSHSGTLELMNDGQPAMRWRIAGGPVQDPSTVPDVLRSTVALREADAVRTRVHTLEEAEDLLERPTRMLLNGTRWHMPVTEQPHLDSTEIWSLVNLTDDTHPIHLHLVRFQILDRQPFDSYAYLKDGRLALTGPRMPPEPSERGWKDTVQAHSGVVTRIIVRFEGYAGQYMWHCHILEHGDNEMMRPLEVVPA
jgi:spore coat protein A